MLAPQQGGEVERHVEERPNIPEIAVKYRSLNVLETVTFSLRNFRILFFLINFLPLRGFRVLLII